MGDLVKVKIQDKIALVRLNRPEKYNALNEATLSLLSERMVALSCDDNVKGVILTGEGKAFCAGGDLKQVGSSSKGAYAALYGLAGKLNVAVTAIKRMEKPVVAALNGPAAGGGFSLAMACDFRVMEKSANMKQAYTSAGLSIDGGGTYMLPRLVGLSRALEIAAFDEVITSRRAHELGLVTKVAEDGQCVAEAKKLLKVLATRSAHSFTLSKQLLNDSLVTSFERQIEKERRAIAECGAHKDGIEGIRAFIEKRPPDFGD